jgi:hypothetical protein
MMKQYMFPIKRGEFYTITDKDIMKNKAGEKYYRSGIYHAKITKINNPYNILFRLNDNNYYTHTDMNQAVRLGFSIELIQDGKANYLFYSQENMLCGKTLFRNYVDFMFKLKQEQPKLKYVKRILNILWGALCERKNGNKYTLREGETITLEENEEIVSIKKYGDNLRILQCEEIGSRFLTGFARIGPFITSLGRKMIGDLALEHVEDPKNIVRIYTDCILSTSKLNLTPKESCALGQFGLEHGKKEVEVLNGVHVNYL